MSWRALPTAMIRDPAWLALSGDARALFLTLRLLLGRAAIGVLWRDQLAALTPESGPALDELVAGEIVIVEALATGEIMVWLRRWALDEDPAVRGKKNATGLLRAVADLPPSRVLTGWYVHHRPILETSGDWPEVANSLSDRLSDSLPDRGSLARGGEGNQTETERETSQKVSLAQLESPDSAREAAGPDGPPRGAPANLRARLRELGVDLPPDLPPPGRTREEARAEIDRRKKTGGRAA